MRVLLSSLLFAFTANLSGQNFSDIEAMMVPLQHMIGNGDTDQDRQRASDSFREKLFQIIGVAEGYDYPFSNLAKLGKVSSPDGAFRIIGWNVPHTDGKYSYHSFLLYPDGKGYIELRDTETLTNADELRTYTADQWYGALYYHIQPVKLKNETYYVLLGWDGNNKSSNKKVMDAMQITRKGEVIFGRPVFASESGIRSRRIWEYAKDVQMMLKYLPEKEAFVLDDLQPRAGYAVGNYAYYGPGTSHNAYQLVKGIWELELNTDLSRPKSVETKAQFNFPERPDLNKKREPAPARGDK